MIKGFLAGILISFGLLVAYLAFHLGFFDSVSIAEGTRGPYHIIFQDHKGAYFQISEKISDVEKHAKEIGLECAKTFGQFFDDPRSIDEDRLRSRGGCISERPYPKVPEGSLAGEIPQGRFVIARFSGSPAIGPWKVYPKLQQYVNEHRLASPAPGSIEIYTLQNDSFSVEYLLPVK